MPRGMGRGFPLQSCLHVAAPVALPREVHNGKELQQSVTSLHEVPKQNRVSLLPLESMGCSLMLKPPVAVAEAPTKGTARASKCCCIFRATMKECAVFQLKVKDLSL